MSNGKYTKIQSVRIGDDTSSGLAFWVTLPDGEMKAIPYSVTRARVINTRNPQTSSFEVETWFAEKEGL